MKTVLVGFLAAGKAGNASFSLPPRLTEDGMRLGAGDGRSEEEAGVIVAGDREDDAAGRTASQLGVGAGAATAAAAEPRAFGRDGKCVEEVEDGPAEPHDACRPAVERELCTVELFNFSTREVPTPLPRTPAVVVLAPAGPGKVG